MHQDLIIDHPRYAFNKQNFYRFNPCLVRYEYWDHWYAMWRGSSRLLSIGHVPHALRSRATKLWLDTWAEPAL